MDIRDSQRIKEIRDNTRAMAEAFGRIADTLAEALELYVSTQTETQNSNLTFEKDECAKEYEELGLKELKELINADRKTENNSEKPNNCEHITEDGVTCARYPACDDCPDNPLNKLKGSERLVKGSGQTEPTISKMEQVEDKPQTEPLHTCSVNGRPYSECSSCEHFKCTADEPQTERSE